MSVVISVALIYAGILMASLGSSKKQPEKGYYIVTGFMFIIIPVLYLVLIKIY